MIEAPLYAQSAALAHWLFANLTSEGVLAERIQRGALALLDHVVLALKDRDRLLNVGDADATAMLLRVHLRLLHELGGLDQRQLVFVTGELDAIGRQLGGWTRRLVRDRGAAPDGDSRDPGPDDRHDGRHR